MTDQREVVPYNDPDEQIIPAGEHLFHYFQTHNPTLADLTRPNNSLPPTNYFQDTARLQQRNAIPKHASVVQHASIPFTSPAAGNGKSLDPFEDRVLWSFVYGNNSPFGKDNNATTSAGSSNNTGNSSRSNVAAGKAVAGPSRTAAVHHATPEVGSGKKAVVILSQTLPTYSCKCCQVLRDIVHTDGNHTAKLELHGKLGVISHGILENRYFHGMPRGACPYEMFDLEQVKEFLRQYMEEKRLGKYMLMEDPLTPYYEAVSVGLVEDMVNSEDFFDESSSDGNEVSQTDMTSRSRKSSPQKRQSLIEQVQNMQLIGCNIPFDELILDRLFMRPSVQRERAAMMTVLDIAAYFHMPIEKASKRLAMCPTVIKKICRRGGVKRWPYRKMKSLDARIRKLRGNMELSHPEDRARIQAQILSLQREVNVTCFGVSRVNG
ncbi:hypothetical protein MLD38_005904 [Melastoma candidum]|uniref:Uncharacterized protein n=1 Tax=Melastoma candidum TaxID=119954 RepID=A0ACB9RL88_9MYRT|nr:hypothetical protein MLD38_005904 [Melastoma candidum]